MCILLSIIFNKIYNNIIYSIIARNMQYIKIRKKLLINFESSYNIENKQFLILNFFIKYNV